MGAPDSGNWNAAGDWDPNEPPFTDDELVDALKLRLRGRWTAKRRDQCPHRVPCKDLEVCVEQIAWYRRHQRAVELSLAAKGFHP
jgi:hypothetical protein